jgi:hypothetical protein
MPTEYGAKKQYGKQKTYGKQVKSHLNGWFGRNLWTEIENSRPTAEANPKASEGQSRKKDSEAKDRSSSEDGIADTIIVKQIVTPESAGEIDNILSKLDNLALSEDTPAPALVERRASIAIAQELHSQSSVGSLRESSDKENESISTFTTAPNTPRKINESENVPFFDTPPRCVLGERESLSIKESPPRKRGLRKRVSASTTGAPSPLKNESFASKEREPSPGWEDSIKVWEDDVQDVIVVRGHLSPVATESNAKGTRKTRSKTKEPLDEQSQAAISATPKTGQLQSVVEGHATEEAGTDAENQTKAVTASPSDDSGDSVLSEHSGFSSSSEVSEVADVFEVGQLLQLCTDQTILDFTECIKSMLKDSSIRKLGEASYSEVFLQSRLSSDSTVLKIIPFGQEEQCELKQIFQEVRITKAMAAVEGFIGFKG